MGTCVITGCSDGIGRATALELSRTNYFDSYALLGRNEQVLAELAQEMKNNNVEIKVKAYYLELSQLDDVPVLIEQIEKDFLEISALLNIAGYTDPQALFTTSLESFEYTYKVNVYAPFVLIRECARRMKTNGGKILNVASTAGMTARPGWLSYASSKAALISMSETLTAELAEYGIKVYCISPGRCATKLRKRLAPNEDPSTIMQPEDVAQVVRNLMSSEEQCLDGQNIVIRKQI